MNATGDLFSLHAINVCVYRYEPPFFPSFDIDQSCHDRLFLLVSLDSPNVRLFIVRLGQSSHSLKLIHSRLIGDDDLPAAEGIGHGKSKVSVDAMVVGGMKRGRAADSRGFAHLHPDLDELRSAESALHLEAEMADLHLEHVGAQPVFVLGLRRLYPVLVIGLRLPYPRLETGSARGNPGPSNPTGRNPSQRRV